MPVVSVAAGDPLRFSAALVAALASVCGCARDRPVTLGPREASTAALRAVRVPGALMVARALDTLTVAIDPSSLAVAQVPSEDGSFLGVEADVVVFERGEAHPVAERHTLLPGPAFDVGTYAWNTSPDGVPLRDKKYVVEMNLILFETDVPPGRDWAPHAGKCRTLWSQTVRQAEE
ncbi:MAG: hypothetical protein M3O36_10490 [Myxococcota bacterium]|nr:hypothetical protein [Myxococcota bacterium]